MVNNAIQRTWWLVGGVVVALIVAAVAMILDARQGERQAAPTPRGAATFEVQAMPDVRVLPAPVYVERGPAVRGAVAGPRMSPASAGWLEICGAPPLALQAHESAQSLDGRIEAAIVRVAPAPWPSMRQSADERIRAAAMAMQRDVGGIVALAAVTRDASVYAMAQQVCMRLPPVAVTVSALAANPATAGGDAAAHAWCARLSARQRATLEPDNAVAWVHVAQQALQEGDANAVDDALHRAQQARTFQRHEYTVADATLRHLASTPAANGLPSGWLERAAQPDATVHPLESLQRVCSGVALERQGRRERCAALADRYVDRASSREDVAQAAGVYALLGHDAATVGAFTRASLEAFDAVDDKLAGMPGRYACARLALLQKHVRQAADGQGRAWVRTQATTGAGRDVDTVDRFGDTRTALRPTDAPMPN